MQTIYYKAQRLAQSQLEVMISRAPVPCLSRQEEERDSDILWAEKEE